MSKEVIDFEVPTQLQDATAQADMTAASDRIASLNARAVMPDGRTLTRGEILQALGLNPNTPPTAWLAIFGCGVNASALLPGDLRRVAVDRVANASTILKRVEGLPGGFVSGGGPG